MKFEPFPEFSAHVIAWQQAQGRHGLPWQGGDPYRVWLSEIMLQQTQVSTVLPYFARFLAQFPDVRTLAAASVDAVLGQWSGLGYYARARNLHRCAQQIVARYGDAFPPSAAAWAELPGVGRSTAAAIAAFTQGERTAILDGNVKRVLCRVFAIDADPNRADTTRTLWALAESLLPETGLAAYTQGLMDLGATCCTPRRPGCPVCPLQDGCRARAQGRVDDLPRRRVRQALPEREGAMLLLRAGRSVLLVRRPARGLWGGLSCLPECAPDEMPDAAAHRLGLPAPLAGWLALPRIRHTFTHFHLRLTPWLGTIAAIPPHGPPDHVWQSLDALADAPLPKPIRTLLADTAAALRSPVRAARDNAGRS